jgi:hypothetical protein
MAGWRKLRVMPWTRVGNTVSFEFAVPPVEPDRAEGWGCIFDFDLAALPRDTPAPTRGTLPRTDGIAARQSPDPAGLMYLTFAILSGLAAGVLYLVQPRRQSSASSSIIRQASSAGPAPEFQVSRS